MVSIVERSVDIAVIGAGPAGLAVARELRHRHRLAALVLDKADTPAASWRRRYDAFRLNTSGFLSHLPGQRIPLAAGRWPTKEDMVDYFDSYARRQNITLRLGCEVEHIDRARDGGWQLSTAGGDIWARVVVLATGGYRTPTTPNWPGLEKFQGEVTHSGDYRNGWPYRGRDVLVVGAGNSGADIAAGLARDGAQRVWLAVRTPPHLVRRALGPIPSDIFLEVFARVPADRIDPLMEISKQLMWGDLSPYGFHRPPLGLKASVEQRGRIPTLADDLVAAVRAGRVQVVAAVEAVAPDHVVLVDGSTVAPEVIITATGFAPDLQGLVGHLGVLDERGNPRGGFMTDLGDGLFAIGYGIPPSGPLRAIRLHATPLAGQIAAYVATTSASLSADRVSSTLRR